MNTENDTKPETTPTPDLASLVAAEDARRDAANAAARAEYDALLAHAAPLQAGDGQRLLRLAEQLGIDARTVRLDVAHATATAKHRAELARLQSEAEAARQEGERLKAARDSYSRALESAGSPQGVLRAAQAAVIFANRDNVKLVEDFLRARGWRRLIHGWDDPRNHGSELALNSARDLQLRRDALPLAAPTAEALAAAASDALGQPRGLPAKLGLPAAV